MSDKHKAGDRVMYSVDGEKGLFSGTVMSVVDGGLWVKEDDYPEGRIILVPLKDVEDMSYLTGVPLTK